MPDEQGFTDDLSIPDNEVLWRRIRKDDIYTDNNSGKTRPKSTCFRDSTRPIPSPMSMTIACLAGKSPQQYLKYYKEEAMVMLTAGQLKEHGLSIEPNPTPEDPGHAFIHGRKNKTIRRKLAEECEWVILPDPL